jgi:hypothetical protein
VGEVSDSGDSVLVVGPLRIPLEPTPQGPRLAPDDPAFEALGWVINDAMEPDRSGVFDAIVNGGTWSGNEIGVEQVRPDTDVGPQLAAWRAVAGRDPKPPLTALAVGFRPMASVVPRSVAAEIAIRLRDLRRQRAVEPPWLFRREPPVWDMAHPSEVPLIEDLDRRARDIDQRAAAFTDRDEPPDLLADRRALLIDLDAAGLLSVDQEAAKRGRLQYWAPDTLLSWYDAACTASRYLASGERRRYRPESTAEPVFGSPVTVDLFRDGLVHPPEVHPYDWASFGELLLAADPLPADEQGSFLHHDADGWVRVRWRRDYGDRPSVRSVALGRSA